MGNENREQEGNMRYENATCLVTIKYRNVYIHCGNYDGKNLFRIHCSEKEYKNIGYVKSIIRKSQKMYLDYFNNFLTISYFAEYYGIKEEKALFYLNIGKLSCEY